MSKSDDDTLNIKKNFSTYLGFVKKYSVPISVVLFLIVLVEGASIVDKFLFKVIIDSGQEFIDTTISSSVFVRTLIILLLVFFTAVIVRAVGKWLIIHLINHIDSGLMADVKRWFFNHVVGLSHKFHTSHKTGSLISRILRGGNAVESLTDVLLFNAAPLVVNILLVAGSLMLFSFTSALIMFLTVVVFVSYSLYIQGAQKRASIISNNAEDREKGTISDMLTNIEAIKYYGKEKSVSSKFFKISERTRKLAIAHWDYFRWLDSGQSLILGLGTFLLIYFPIVSLLNHEITLGTLVFIWTVYGQVIGPLFGFVWGIRRFYEAMANCDALFKYNDFSNDIQDLPDAKPLVVSHGGVQFSSVSFSYNKRKVIKNFSLKINPNEKVALVGHSGSGKTTIIKLLYRLYDANLGSISIDGKNINAGAGNPHILVCG